MAKKIIQFDWALKKLLRQKANYDILEGFLSVLLNQDIIIKNIIDSESNKEDENDKYNRVDVFAESTSGELIIIEVQVNSEIDYFHRMTYGTGKAISEYMNAGEKYANVKKIYSVNIVYFDLGQGKDYVYHGITEFKGLHHNDILELSDKQLKVMPYVRVSDIFPEYYVLRVNDFDDLAKDSLDEWIYVLKNSEVKDEFKAKGIDKLKEKLAYESMSLNEKRTYNAYLQIQSVTKSEFWSAKVEGIIEGREEGFSIEKRRTAYRGFEKGYSDDIISDLNGLSLEEVKMLREDWGKEQNNKKK